MARLVVVLVVLVFLPLIGIPVGAQDEDEEFSEEIVVIEPTVEPTLTPTLSPTATAVPTATPRPTLTPDARPCANDGLPNSCGPDGATRPSRTAPSTCTDSPRMSLRQVGADVEIQASGFSPNAVVFVWFLSPSEQTNTLGNLSIATRPSGRPDYTVRADEECTVLSYGTPLITRSGTYAVYLSGARYGNAPEVNMFQRITLTRSN